MSAADGTERVSDAQEGQLPHWDMTSVYPAIESSEFGTALAGIAQELGDLQTLFDTRSVRRCPPVPLDEATIALFEDVTHRLNALLDRVRTCTAYLHSFVTTNSRDDMAQATLSRLQSSLVALDQLETRYVAWIGSLDVDALVDRSTLAKGHDFPLHRAAEAARHQMGEAEEDLAARLNLTSGTAWAKLHGNVTSRLIVTMRFPDGSDQTLPMSAIRGLAYHTDQATRRVAYEAELRGWETVTVPLAAALNSIKGQVNTLGERRGWSDPLDEALFINALDHPSLTAMQTACEEAFPDFRRYLQVKARLLGHKALPWWEIFAPVSGAGGARHWSFTESTVFVIEQFGAYSPRMAGLAARAVRERWIDAEPRDGKRDGAFCMGVRGDESRVLMNYQPSFSSLQTMAHELGHAYHNLNLAGRTPLQRQTPMALAETASIFCQTVVTNAALANASEDEQLAIIEDFLQDACQVVVDIHSRFLFEQGVFLGRRQRELSIEELNTLMLEAQSATYGNGLDQTILHPYMWAVKGHYYSTERSYYNWPYTFGLLFGLGLYARYRNQPDSFRAGYDALLASTGLDTAANLAKRFDIDINAIDFWRSSLDVVRGYITRFEALAQRS